MTGTPFSPELFRAFDAAACILWAIFLAIALYRRRFGFGRSRATRLLFGPSGVVERETRPAFYWGLVAGCVALILWTGIAAIL
jgi:hypothetical protein